MASNLLINDYQGLEQAGGCTNRKVTAYRLGIILILINN
jgi:hypothetical protein